MPQFKDKPCEGTCERLGQSCKREKHFIEMAEIFKAKPKQYSSMFNSGTPTEVTWYFWGLTVPKSEEAAMYATLAQYTPELVNEDGTIWPYWMKEFPCYMDCEITICGYCSKQHEKDLMRDGYCLYDAAPKKTAKKTYYAQNWKNIQDNLTETETVEEKEAVATPYPATKHMPPMTTEEKEAAVEETIKLLSPEAAAKVEKYRASNWPQNLLGTEEEEE